MISLTMYHTSVITEEEEEEEWTIFFLLSGVELSALVFSSPFLLSPLQSFTGRCFYNNTDLIIAAKILFNMGISG